MEIKIQFCPTIWESDSGERIGQGSFRCASSLAPVRVAARFRNASGERRASLQWASRRASGERRGALQGRVEERSGERIGQGSFRCASSLAPVRVVARFRCASGRASGRFGVSFRVLSRRAQVSELARNASGARRCKLQGRVEARSGERIGQETLQVCVEPRSSARRGALQVSVGAHFRVVLRSAQVSELAKEASGARRAMLQCASSHAPVRVEARFRCASSLAPVRVAAHFRVVLRSAQVSELAKEASGARRASLQCASRRSSGARRGGFRSLRGKLQGRVEERSGERIGQGSFRVVSRRAQVSELASGARRASLQCASRRASGARRGALRGRVKARFGVVSRRASERGGYPERDTRQGSRMDEARFRCPLFRPGGWTRQSECG
ncbi:hypothetical protein CK203_019180 [Vitis vinifera]|uniref:Uncharacterized protein n=1 Tax=Vitis vinifera TaxID=29760 RepID=A0A438J7N0_VITVI|nr:hypothetical protein CK203_019180 [Vitis vinifera]